MKLKLILAMVSDDRTQDIVKAARDAGATGSTIISSARGEGLTPEKSFFGLDLAGQMDVILFIVAAERVRMILESIAVAGRFDSDTGAGMALQIDVEDAVGLTTQRSTILKEVEEEV